MIAADLPTWHRDRVGDFAGIDPSWPVVESTCKTAAVTGSHDDAAIENYRKAYAGGLPVPPVTFVDDMLASGAHRLAGAYRAGLAEIPCHIVQVPR